MAEYKMDIDELIAFSNQMAMILKAGISTSEGLSIMKEDSKNQSTRDVFQGMIESMEIGCNFSEAIKEAGIFPEYFENMIVIGERAGRLEEVLISLSDYYRQQSDIKKSIKSAITYPLVMLVMMLLVVLVLIIKVLPVFNQVYEQLGTTITGFSRGVMNFGVWLTNYSIWIIGVIIVIIVIVVYLVKSKSGNKKLNNMLAKMPMTKNISYKLAVSRFAGSLAIALKSGLDINDSLTLVATIVSHPTVSPKILKCKEMVDEQIDFEKSIDEVQLFTGLYARMFSIGVKTGTSDDVMESISNSYLEEANEDIDHLITIIEPTIVAILAVVVGIILISVMLPLISIMSSL